MFLCDIQSVSPLRVSHVVKAIMVLFISKDVIGALKWMFMIC